MTQTLTDLLAAGHTGLVAGFIVFLRVGAVMAVMPAFGERSVPERVRLVLALAFTVIVAPAVADRVLPLIDTDRGMVPIMLGEVVAGLALGLALRLFVLALQMAGSIAAQSTSLSQIFGGGMVEPQPAIGQVMVISGLALAVMTGLHIRVTEALIGSYNAFPPGVVPSRGLIAEWGLIRISQAFSLAFTLAAPFVIASFIYNLALGVINRAMPQLMVAFVGAPAITAGGLILLALSLPLILSVWNIEMQQFLSNPFGAQR